jgi:hypothetical protein
MTLRGKGFRRGSRRWMRICSRDRRMNRNSGEGRRRSGSGSGEGGRKGRSGERGRRSRSGERGRRSDSGEGGWRRSCTVVQIHKISNITYMNIYERASSYRKSTTTAP